LEVYSKIIGGASLSAIKQTDVRMY